MTRFQQQGLTLIELMISITLGLIVVAAAISVFLAGQTSLNTQTGLGDLQQNSMFGISQMVRDIRHAGLNTNASKSTGREVEGSGIVFDATAFTGIEASRVTQTESAANPIFRDLHNDRLTIQFKPHTADTLYSCKGRALAKDELNVQTYFVQEVASGRYGLYCDADNTNENFGSPVLLIPDVEALKVRFAVKNGKNMQYKNIAGIVKGDEIVSIELGLSMRSAQNVGTSNGTKADGYTYKIAGETLTLSTSDTQYIREVFNQVIAIRNSTGG